MQYVAIMLGIIFTIGVIFAPSNNSDMKSIKLEMCKKDAKCVYSPNDIPNDMVREYYKNK
jgi:hypothetical protein